MATITTSILPKNQTFVKVDKERGLNYKAICVFVATGFFLDQDSYWSNEVCLPPSSNNVLDENGYFQQSEPWFQWYYEPRQISFKAALDEYIELFTSILKTQVKDNPVILPLSGGLDSRSQALVLSTLNNPVNAFSYSFRNGYPEHLISKKIAQICGFNFQEYHIEEGYLWSKIEKLASINNCYSEFTHPRQMAIFDALQQYKGVMSLGHWGDVLFDRGAPESLDEADIIPYLFKKMIKPKGLELAQKLWTAWNIEGDFNDYLNTRIEDALSKIKIKNTSAKLRAFKTTHWAHRWTTTNLSVFEATNPITLPYYHDEMCKFICTVPEEFLADRKLQIAHIKTHKALAKVKWQAFAPFNLYTYKYSRTPYNLPSKIRSKVSREVSKLRGQNYVQRNWELQFIGEQNDKQLQSYLFSKEFEQFIPRDVINFFYKKFKTEAPVNYAHPLSMLLTLAVFHKHNN